MKPQITLYLDQRRSKSGNLFPVKLRIWNALTKKAKLFPTNIDLGENEFKQALESKKPKKEHQLLRIQLEAIKAKAQEVADELPLFTFEGFERKFFRKTGSGININYHYDQVIDRMKNYGQIGTASNYDLSLKSLLKFNQIRGGKTTMNLSFYDISADWLKGYENFMTKDQGKSYTTVGIYLRPLRAIFNKAISENEIKSDIYPFGNKKYKIPASKNTKKALSKEQLKKLLEYDPKNDFQKKARAFWFFSYSCSGMNIKDIALLKFKDIQDGAVRFYRAKTINTTKGNMRPITSYLTPFAKQVIELYGNSNRSPETYVFDILKPDLSPVDQKKAIQNFTRFINQHISNLCKDADLPEISSYWARHSFATMSIRSGASMEMVQESLGHGNLSTTMNYFAGFEDETKKEFAAKLMEF